MGAGSELDLLNGVRRIVIFLESDKFLVSFTRGVSIKIYSVLETSTVRLYIHRGTCLNFSRVGYISQKEMSLYGFKNYRAAGGTSIAEKRLASVTFVEAIIEREVPSPPHAGAAECIGVGISCIDPPN